MSESLIAGLAPKDRASVREMAENAGVTVDAMATALLQAHLTLFRESAATLPSDYSARLKSRAIRLGGE